MNEEQELQEYLKLREQIRKKRLKELEDNDFNSHLKFDDADKVQDPDYELEHPNYDTIEYKPFELSDEEDDYADDDTLEDEENFESREVLNKPPKKNKGLDIIIYLLLFILPIVSFFSIVSFHTHYLVRRPFDYICIVSSSLIVLTLIILFIIRFVRRDKSKSHVKCGIKYIVFFTILTILDGGLLYIFVKKRAWNLADRFIAHYKLILLILFILFLLFVILIIIMKLKKRKIKSKIKRFILNFILFVYILCFVDGTLILYRSQAFKEWLITTAMQTMNHQYLCKWFYSKGEINKVLGANYVVESGESTDPTLIKKEETVTYANEYERQILEREEGASYKIINLDVNGCKGYLAAVYDPTTVHLLVTKNLGRYGQYVTTMAKENNAVLAINGGGFYDPGNSSTGGSPTGITISDGKVVTRGEYGTRTQSGGIIGFDNNGILYLLKDLSVENAVSKGITNAITWGPFLIVNGEKSFIKGNGGWGYAARTAIGQRKDGIVLFLVVDSNATRTNGADMVDLTEIMYNYGAINAANLDGGTSSVMVEHGELINDPIDAGLNHETRAIADAFAVIEKPKAETTTSTSTQSTKSTKSSKKTKSTKSKKNKS